MTREIGTTANITKIRLAESSAPSTPDSGYGYLYAKTDGLYYKGDDGTEIGPLAEAGSGGGRTLISSQTPTGTGTVTFSSIPGTYSKLIIEVLARGTQAATNVAMDIVLNSDTTDANYRQIAVGWYASTTIGAGAAADNNVIEAFILAANAPADKATYCITEIPQYANTSFHKNIFHRSSKRVDSSSVYLHGNLTIMEWYNTAAITSIDLVLSAGNFGTGSIINLYGED